MSSCIDTFSQTLLNGESDEKSRTINFFPSKQYTFLIIVAIFRTLDYSLIRKEFDFSKKRFIEF